MKTPHLLKLLGWNTRPLTYEDFEEACHQQEIIIQRAPIKTLGMYFLCEDRPIITLSSSLYGPRLWLVAWHELTHHLLHPPGLRCFTNGMVSKLEAQAQSVGICSVLDQRTFSRILSGEELHDLPKDMLKLRMRVAIERDW